MGKKVKKEAESPTTDVFDPLPIESKNAATVVLMLKSPEEEILAKACEAIHKFAEKADENKTTLLDLGAVEPLSKLVSHEDKAVQRNAIMAVGVMASCSDVRRVLKKYDVIPAMIGKLSPEEDLAVHEFATLCLALLSVDYICKVQIFDHDGLEPLIQLLSSPDPDVKKNSVECIFNLVQDFPVRLALCELNGIPPLLEQLSSEFPIIQQLALRTLQSVTTDLRTHSAFREEQGFDRLLEVLTNKEFSDLHLEALQVISNCLEDIESMRFFQETGGLEKLLQFVITATQPEVQTNAIKAITRAAQSGDSRKILHEQEVEKALVHLLVVENDSVQTATCQAVAAMCKNLTSQDTFRHLEGIKPIVQLLSSEDTELREAAAQALSSLTTGNQLNAYVVYEADGDKLLVQQLLDECPGTVAYAAAVLTSMASQESLRRSILAHGGAQMLVEPLQSTDRHVLVCATQAVAALACDAEARAEFTRAGGLPLLVKLLESSNSEIRRNACWAVSVCASDEPTVTKMCKFGALEILQEINTSTNRKNKFSEVALQRLLDGNLSVKYSLTGCLSPSDIITDGFYDPGQTRAGHKVPSLEDLSKQAVNQRRAIIAVNGKPQDQVCKEPSEERQDSPTDAHALGRRGNSKTLSRGKSRGPKDDDKQKDDDEGTPQVEVESEGPGILPCDPALQDLVTEAAKIAQAAHEERELYSALAKLVCDAMGGPVDPDKHHDFLWELHLSELKLEMQSNIIPVGKIKMGTYYHRALLYKVLADRIGVSCSLVRGDYNRAWNEVLLSSSLLKVAGGYPEPRRYVVDLMHNPGNLMMSNSPAATQYQTI